ncbi:hypothetical protein ACHAXT_008153 [Thalassiosira profunda]
MSAKRRGKGGGPKSSSAKRPREEGSSGGPFDQLCDDALLRIVSYTNDLRSLVRFTMCTSKSLRGRFDPKSTSRAQGECHKIWKGVFADLQMDPPDLDYLKAINDRMALLKTLVGHDKRRKLPLRHFYFKPLDWPWRLENNSDDSLDECAVEDPFCLMSSGTGGEYIIVNPETYMLEVHGNLLDSNSVCFDKSIQKKRQGHRFNTLEETLDLFLDVARGVGTSAHTQGIKIVAQGGGEFDSVPWARIGGEGGSLIWMVRLVKEGAPVFAGDGSELFAFTEVYSWTRGGGEDERERSQFILQSVTRIPGEWENGFSILGDRLFGTISEEAYNAIPERYRIEVPDVESAVFEIPMDMGIWGAFRISRPQHFYLANGVVSSITVSEDETKLLVGTEEGRIEICDCDSQALPQLTHTLYADGTFNAHDGVPNMIMWMYEVGDSLPKLGLIAVQACDSKGSAFTLWQPSSLESGSASDLKVVARIRYPRYTESILAGCKLVVLSYDKFGWAYVDIYIILGRFVFDELDCPNLPKEVELANLHPQEEQRIKFLNRIHTHYRVDFEDSYQGLITNLFAGVTVATFNSALNLPQLSFNLCPSPSLIYCARLFSSASSTFGSGFPMIEMEPLASKEFRPERAKSYPASKNTQYLH